MPEHYTDLSKRQEKASIIRNYKKFLLPLLIVVLITAGAGAYWFRDTSAKSDAKKQTAEITSLKQKVSGLEKDLASEKAKSATDAQTIPAAKVPSQDLIDNIKAVFATGNTAALEGYMASSVNVIIAASEGIGTRTPEQATADITSYMTNATVPWNFDLPAATVEGWRSGGYAQYFPTNAVVGRSDKVVMSFSFNTAGKISGVFMSISDELL